MKIEFNPNSDDVYFSRIEHGETFMIFQRDGANGVFMRLGPDYTESGWNSVRLHCGNRFRVREDEKVIRVDVVCHVSLAHTASPPT